jgi:beta-N-acetylhexosaminidase
LTRLPILAARAATIIAALVLAGLDLIVPDSLIHPYNRALGIGVLCCAILLSALLVRARHRWSAVVFAGLGLGAAWQLVSPSLDRRVVLARTDARARDIERHFVVGYEDLATAQELVRDARIGGLFLTQRNVQGRTVASVAAEIAGLQALRRASSLPSLLVAADQEGGTVSHLSPPLSPPPALSTLASLPAQERATQAWRLGREVGTGLRRIGVTMDLAPVCDLLPRQASAALDLHTHIEARAISSDPTITATIAQAFSAGLLTAGVTPTAKHFPGLARVPTDTHLFGATLAVRQTDLSASDWVPFRAVMAVPGSAVMLSHVALQAVDPDVPVSRSRAVVTGLLRGQMRFEGITITDDLTMGAVEHAGLCRAVEGALNAGVDLLLVSWNVDKAYPAMRCALEALDGGRLNLTTLQQSARRLDELARQAPAGLRDAAEP